MYVKLNGEMVYLWRAVDQEGEILESYVTKTRDKAAALTFMKKALKRHGSPATIVTDGLKSYRAAMTELGNGEKQEVGRHANNRAENSHLPFRRRERAMLRFRRMKTLQKFASVHANIANHFNQERHLVSRQEYKTRRSAALAFMKKARKRHGSPATIVTDGLRSYRAAMVELGNEDKQEVGRHANNRVENSHPPFRRRERAMLRFRQMKTLQKFASVHANIATHFNQERHLVSRQEYKQRRSAALAEWQSLMA